MLINKVAKVQVIQRNRINIRYLAGVEERYGDKAIPHCD